MNVGAGLRPAPPANPWPGLGSPSTLGAHVKTNQWLDSGRLNTFAPPSCETHSQVSRLRHNLTGPAATGNGSPTTS